MTDVQDDDVTPLEYLIAGLVVLSFGLLYYLINHGSGFLSGGEHDTNFAPGSAYTASADTSQKNSLANYQPAEATPTAPATDGDSSEETTDDTKAPDTEQAESQNVTDETEAHPKQAAADKAMSDAMAEQQQQTQQRQVALDNELAQLKSEVNQHKAEIARLKQLEAERAQQAEQEAATEPQAEGFENDLQNLMANQEKNKAITFDKIYFDPGSAVLKPESQAQIEAVAEQLNKHADTKIMIRGHTDNTGSAGRNSLVSLSRSGSMKDALVKLGVDAERIKIEGVGALEPIASNDTEEGREKNRRIELIVIE